MNLELPRPRVCVFCGSSSGSRPEYADAARQVGAAIANQGWPLVYGGGRVGLMGIVADSVLQAGGQVIGVIPDALARKEIAHDGLTELHIVPDMHTRKALMAQLSDGFLALPGGVGTFEEFFEIYTWAVLNIHRKPIAILNTAGYYDPILTMLDRAVHEKFLPPDYQTLVQVADRPEDLIPQFLSYIPPQLGPKWMDLNQT